MNAAGSATAGFITILLLLLFIQCLYYPPPKDSGWCTTNGLRADKVIKQQWINKNFSPRFRSTHSSLTVGPRELEAPEVESLRASGKGKVNRQVGEEVCRQWALPGALGPGRRPTSRYADARKVSN